jgi:hypothetical protein
VISVRNGCISVPLLWDLKALQLYALRYTHTPAVLPLCILQELMANSKSRGKAQCFPSCSRLGLCFLCGEQPVVLQPPLACKKATQDSGACYRHMSSTDYRWCMLQTYGGTCYRHMSSTDYRWCMLQTHE